MSLTAEDLTVQQLAARAADEIERRGLTRATLVDYTTAGDKKDCKVCLVGALALAYFGDAERGYDDDSDEGYARFVGAIAEHVPTKGWDSGASATNDLYMWNDGIPPDDQHVFALPKPTQEEVVAFLRGVAAEVAA